MDIEWSDGHFSRYTSDWLRNRVFRDEKKQWRHLMAKGPKKVLWGKEYLDNIRYHKYDSIIDNPREMYDWINGKKYSLIFLFDV